MLCQPAREQLISLLGQLGNKKTCVAAVRPWEIAARSGFDLERDHCGSFEHLRRAGPALALLEHPEITKAETATLRRLSLWRAPGAAGLAQVQAIAERLGTARLDD